MSISEQIARLLGLGNPLKVDRQCQFRHVRPGEFWSFVGAEFIWLRVDGGFDEKSVRVGGGTINGRLCATKPGAVVTVWAKEE